MNWKKSAWLCDRYEVSDTGAVRSLYSRHGLRKIPRAIKPCLNKHGYREFTARLNGRSVHVLVHRAVLYTFCGAPGVGQQANHLNGVRTDNRVANLAWASAQENIVHSYAVLGRAPNKPFEGRSGVLHHLSKAVAQLAADGTVMRVFGSVAEAGRAGFSSVCVSRVCNGTAKQHKGFVWAFSNQTNSI